MKKFLAFFAFKSIFAVSAPKVEIKANLNLGYGIEKNESVKVEKYEEERNDYASNKIDRFVDDDYSGVVEDESIPLIDKLKELDRQVTESPVNKENYENVVDQRVIPSGDFIVLFPIEVKEKIKVKLRGGLGIGYSKAILTQQSKLTKDFHEEI